MKLCVVILLFGAVISECHAAYNRHQPTTTTTTTPLPLPTVLEPRLSSVDLVTVPSPPDVCVESANEMMPLSRLRAAMRTGVLRHTGRPQHQALDALVIYYTDEHLSEDPAPSERRLEYFSGWDGPGTAVITLNGSAALWVPSGSLQRAKATVSCPWQVLDADNQSQYSISNWITDHLLANPRIGHSLVVGGDYRLTTFSEWQSLDAALQQAGIELVNDQGLADALWRDGRPEQSKVVSIEHQKQISGMPWTEKLYLVRNELRAIGADTMVVTALDEVAWLLNVRGRDVPHAPLLKAFVVIGPVDVTIYAPDGKISMPVREALHVSYDNCRGRLNCTIIKDYQTVYADLKSIQSWSKILVPSPATFHRGASAAIVQNVPPQKRVHEVSPIIYLKAQKNIAEIRGMKDAHLKDAVAMCTVLHYLETHMRGLRRLDELKVAKIVDETRVTQRGYIGPSTRTRVAFSMNSANPDYMAINMTNEKIFPNSTLVLQSGGQYVEGTTLVTRTLHFGIPMPNQKVAYTTTLKALSALSMLSAPPTLLATHADTVGRAALWAKERDYPHPTGHGVGAALNVKEDPVVLDYRQDTNLHILREGYFLTIEPAWYEGDRFGTRLGNVVEVVARSPDFLRLREATLVPFEPRLIDYNSLTDNEIKWLNDYNHRIRTEVGQELLSQGLISEYYWMGNKTVPIVIEPKRRTKSSSAAFTATKTLDLCIFMLIILVV